MVAKLERIADELMKKIRHPGIGSRGRDGETIYAKGFGVEDMIPATPENLTHTVFQLASVSKSISSTVVAHRSART